METRGPVPGGLESYTYYCSTTLPSHITSIKCYKIIQSSIEIHHGASINEGDELYWEATAEPGYIISYTYTSSNPYIVTGDVEGSTASKIVVTDRASMSKFFFLHNGKERSIDLRKNFSSYYNQVSIDCDYIGVSTSTGTVITPYKAGGSTIYAKLNEGHIEKMHFYGTHEGKYSWLDYIVLGRALPENSDINLEIYKYGTVGNGITGELSLYGRVVGKTVSYKAANDLIKIHPDQGHISYSYKSTGFFNYYDSSHQLNWNPDGNSGTRYKLVLRIVPSDNDSIIDITIDGLSFSMNGNGRYFIIKGSGLTGREYSSAQQGNAVVNDETNLYTETGTWEAY